MMVFTKTKISGVYLVDLKKLDDERGFFARSWCMREASEIGIDPNVVQCNISFNKVKGTLRGMHFQIPPFAESKLVRVTRGAIYDVIIDLRADSETFKQWMGVELTADNRRALFVPKGFAHGFQTLEDDTEIFYQMSEFYSPDHARGVRWDDPAFDIQWPLELTEMSPKDSVLPDFDPKEFSLLTINELT